MGNRWYRVVYTISGKLGQRVRRVSAPGPLSAANHVRATNDYQVSIKEVKPDAVWVGEEEYE